MWFKRSIAANPTRTEATSSKAIGDSAEDRALRYLLSQGLTLIARNFKTPGRGGGEVDLIMRAADGTVVFVEVRHRKLGTHGGAAASVTPVKQRRIVFAAQHYLRQFPHLPPCRFDVLTVQGGEVDAPMEWFRAAFDAT